MSPKIGSLKTTSLTGKKSTQSFQRIEFKQQVTRFFHGSWRYEETNRYLMPIPNIIFTGTCIVPCSSNRWLRQTFFFSRVQFRGQLQIVTHLFSPYLEIKIHMTLLNQYTQFHFCIGQCISAFFSSRKLIQHSQSVRTTKSNWPKSDLKKNRSLNAPSLNFCGLLTGGWDFWCPTFSANLGELTGDLIDSCTYVVVEKSPWTPPQQDIFSRYA